MFTPRFRALLIVLAVTGGLLLRPAQPRLALLLFAGGALVVVGYFRYGTVWIAFRAFRLGRMDRATALIDQVWRPEWLNGQHRAYYHWIRGASELQAGRQHEAIGHLARSLEGRLRTSNARCGVALTMAQAYLELGDLDQAEAALEAAGQFPHQEALNGILAELEERLRQLRHPELHVPVRLTGRLVHLRDPVPTDLEALVRWWTTDREWMEWDAPWKAESTEEAQVRVDCEKLLARPPDLPRQRLIICLPDETPVGRVNLYPLDSDPGRIALGIDLHESGLWGRGLGGEAFALWAAYVFREHQADRLYCETWSGNERMLRVAARLGFREVSRRRGVREVRGEIHDALRLAVERDEFPGVEGST